MDRILQRRESLRQNLKAGDLDALLVSSPTNVSYLTGFTGDSSVLLVGRQNDLILSDGRFTTQLQQECPGLEACIRPAGQTMSQAIVQAVGAMGIGRLGFEASVLSVAEFETIRQALPAVSLVATAERVEALRQIKDSEEIAAIREAIAFAEQAFLMLLPEIRRGDRPRSTSPTCWTRTCGGAERPARASRRSWRWGSARPCRTRDRPTRPGSAMTISSSSTGVRPAGPTKVT